MPEAESEDGQSFTLGSLEAAKAFYAEQGYVVVRRLISPALCASLRAAFDSEVRQSRTPILRQKNMRYERNSLDGHGFLHNPIFNVQDLSGRRLAAFRAGTLDILTHEATARVTAALLGAERAKLIQSMFFEAPAGTWAHQDSYYQDSAAGLGGCVAGWFALEDIDAGAGRFYVCPGSHRSLAPLRNAGAYNFATGHGTYQKAMLQTMRDEALPIVAPFLAAGDVLFWNSLTVHGSLPASRPGVSRTSLTAHYLAEDDAMLQFHTRVRAQRTIRYNGMTVGLLHDQRRMTNRLLREIAFHAPGPYMAARRVALRGLLMARQLRRPAATP